MERQSFEDSLKDALKGAEIAPGDKVWNNIELDLARAEGEKMKKRVFFYQLLAAASITFALLVTGIGYYAFQQYGPGSTNTIATIQKEDNAEKAGERSPDNTAQEDESRTNLAEASHPASDLQSNDAARLHEKQTDRLAMSGQRLDGQSQRASDKRSIAIDRRNELQRTETGSPSVISGTTPEANRNLLMTRDDFSNQSGSAGTDGITIASGKDRNSGSTAIMAKADARILPPLYDQKEIAVNFKTKPIEQEADPVALMFAKLEDLERELAGESEQKNKKSKSDREHLWTSVGFAAGGFNSTRPGVTNTAASQSSLNYSNSVNNQTKASGVAYSVGINMGTQVATRWVIQGGLNYLSQNSNYTSDQVVTSPDLQNFKAATLSDFRSAESARADNKVIPTAPHSVNNNVEFVSVPVQAGYLVINRKIGLQLNAGVSTDLFLKSTVDPEGSGLTKTVQERGEDSDYRSLNFSGLVSTELSYRLSNRYKVALNPGIRYPFNSIYKDNVGINATPITFDVGLRFRYIFQ